MFETSHLQHNIVSGHIQIVAEGRYSPAFWAHPQLGGPFPGLVLLHDQRGLTAQVRIQARRFAEQGYYVVVPDLIGGSPPDDDPHSMALRSVDAALAVLKSHHHCSGKLGLLGWRSGGAWALRSAMTRDDLRAVVTFDGVPADRATEDGAFDLEFDLLLTRVVAVPCAVLALFALRESVVSLAQIRALEVAAERIGGHWSVVRYPDVAPGFFDDSDANFDPDMASDAWQRASAFLNTHLDAHLPPEREVFDTGRVY